MYWNILAEWSLKSSEISEVSLWYCFQPSCWDLHHMLLHLCILVNLKLSNIQDPPQITPHWVLRVSKNNWNDLHWEFPCCVLLREEEVVPNLHDSGASERSEFTSSATWAWTFSLSAYVPTNTFTSQKIEFMMSFIIWKWSLWSPFRSWLVF